MKISSLPAYLLAAACSLPVAAFGNTLTLSGDNTNAPVFNRPTQTGAASFQNPHYQAYQFSVSLSGPYDFSLVAADPIVFDTFLHLYQAGFNPADPQTNFLAANDDASNNPDAGSALNSISLVAGTSYYFVADGFSVQDYGAYTATLSGPGSITAIAVPEPSSVALLSLAASGVLLARRARRKA